MVEGLPGSDFAGVKHYPLTYKYGGGSGAVWRRGLFVCLVCVLRVVLLSGARIVCGVFLCSENVLRKMLSEFFS